MQENVSDVYLAKQAVNNIRDCGYQFTVTDRCEKRYNPKWCHTGAVKNMLIDGFDKKENETMDAICMDICSKALQGGKKAGWSGKFTFLC